jgi:hypothetical protein
MSGSERRELAAFSFLLTTQLLVSNGESEDRGDLDGFYAPASYLHALKDFTK